MRSECPVEEVGCILDVGCNRGGLLQLLAGHFHPDRILGLEPLDGPRQRAQFRLRNQANDVKILDSSRWSVIQDGSVDLAVAHEMLYLVADLRIFMGSLARVLRPDGWAYIVLGCHSENPLWARWKTDIAEFGHDVFDHSPMNVIREAAIAGFHASVRPLRHDGWVVYNPLATGLQYDSVTEMFNHQYRQKLLFRLVKQATPGPY